MTVFAPYRDVPIDNDDVKVIVYNFVEKTPAELKDIVDTSYIPEGMTFEDFYPENLPADNDWDLFGPQNIGIPSSKLELMTLGEYKQYIKQNRGYYEDIVKDILTNNKLANPAEVRKKVYPQYVIKGDLQVLDMFLTYCIYYLEKFEDANLQNLLGPVPADKGKIFLKCGKCLPYEAAYLVILNYLDLTTGNGSLVSATTFFHPRLNEKEKSNFNSERTTAPDCDRCRSWVVYCKEVEAATFDLVVEKVSGENYGDEARFFYEEQDAIDYKNQLLFDPGLVWVCASDVDIDGKAVPGTKRCRLFSKSCLDKNLKYLSDDAVVYATEEECLENCFEETPTPTITPTPEPTPSPS